LLLNLLRGQKAMLLLLVVIMMFVGIGLYVHNHFLEYKNIIFLVFIGLYDDGKACLSCH
jgi:hypothetical protein